MLANLIVNGDFEAGNTGFTSGYRYSPGNIRPAAVYDVLRNPAAAHDIAASFGDHTSGSGLMMAVNGAIPPNEPEVWAQTVTVIPNIDYKFSVAIATTIGVFTEPPRRVDFYVGDRQFSTTTPLSEGTWEEFEPPGMWNSGSATSVTVRIIAEPDVNGNTASDFALDDISLVKVDNPDLSVTTPIWTAGQGVDFSYTIGGASLTQPATVGLYWSTDTTYDDGQDEAAFTTLTQTATGTYPVSPTHDNLAPPTSGLNPKYLLAVIDPSNAVAEPDEPNHPNDFGSNNVESLGVPDLASFNFGYRVASQAFGFVDNSILPVGAAFTVTGRIDNLGTGDAGAFDVKLYASRDATIDPSNDVFIDTLASVQRLASGTVTFILKDVPAGWNLPEHFFGVVHLGLVVDPADQVVESSESNNYNQSTDHRPVRLYDPIAPRMTRTETFGTMPEAEAFLRANGYEEPTRFPGFEDNAVSWSRRSPTQIRSRFNGILMPGRAFRSEAVIIQRGGVYRIRVQQWEPNPRFNAIWGLGAAWAIYVRDYHANF